MWEAWGNYAMRNGNYSISKAMVKGKWLYQLWQITPVNGHGVFTSYEQAQAAHKKILSKEK